MPTRTVWCLSALMAEHRVKGPQLRQELGVSKDTLQRWRSSEVPPNMQRVTYDNIAAALTKLSKKRGVVRGEDLIKTEDVKEEENVI
jgi:DNA-binding Xre family transcriptional regulator